MLKLNSTTAVKIIIFLCFTAGIYAADEIDINSLTTSNPFAQFAQKQQPVRVSNAGISKPELVVETATLKFLDAKSVRTTIINMASDFGNIETDNRGNSLIICDTPENVEKIMAQIRKIDRKPEQIMVEVVLVDVKIDDETEIGVNWDFLNDSIRNGTYRQDLTFSNRLSSTIKNAANTGNATAFNTIGGPAGDFWLVFDDIRTVIHALQLKNDVEILASPRVMVVSGQKASIESVEEIPYSERSETSQGGEMTSTQFKNVGVTLDIGATLTDDKYILLDVESGQKVRTGESGADNVPVVDARMVKSSLLLEDGQTLVIGGLRRKEIRKQVNQIPFLGDLPVVGYAFKATDEFQVNSELLIILSPHIYKGQAPNASEMRKYNEITKRPLLTIQEFEEKKQKAKEEKIKQKQKADKEKEKKEKKK